MVFEQVCSIRQESSPTEGPQIQQRAIGYLHNSPAITALVGASCPAGWNGSLKSLSLGKTETLLLRTLSGGFLWKNEEDEWIPEEIGSEGSWFQGCTLCGKDMISG